MLLSEMLGVERDTEFGVKGYEEKFKIICGCTLDGEDLERIFYTGSNRWSMLQSIEVFCTILRGAPSGIIHLPPPLTDEQREQLKAIWTLGGRWIAKDKTGNVYAYDSKPEKIMSCHYWNNDEDDERFTVIRELSVCSLLSWSDPEPYDIGKALGVKG